MQAQEWSLRCRLWPFLVKHVLQSLWVLISMHFWNPCDRKSTPFSEAWCSRVNKTVTFFLILTNHVFIHWASSFPQALKKGIWWYTLITVIIPSYHVSLDDALSTQRDRRQRLFSSVSSGILTWNKFVFNSFF